MNYLKNTRVFLPAILLGIIMLLTGCNTKLDTSSYLFVYFTGNGPGEEAIRFAVSEDGYNFRALNNNEPILSSEAISLTGGVRDPHILRGNDGKTFYMVATDLLSPIGWKSNRAMVLLKSTDLINWTSNIVNIQKRFPEGNEDLLRVWAPQTIYDAKAKKYMVYWSMKQGEGDKDKIYYAYANADFTGLETAPKQLYFPPAESNTRACIDADIIPFNGKFYLFHKADDSDPGIKLAISDHLTEGYQLVSDKRVDKEIKPVEGSGIFKLNHSNDWILMYDVYTSGRYQFTKSSDLQNFTVIDQDISMNFHPRHGTVMPITEIELKRLINQWGGFDDLLVDATSASLKKNNVYFKNQDKTIYLPVKHGTNLQQFDPEFKAFKGISVNPTGPQDFTKGAVEYTFEMEGKGKEVYSVSAEEDHNPIVEGYYADPEIIYSQKTNKYYIYPTSDGFTNWSGTYFKTFSSPDLVHWTDEGVILDLKKDVSWADRNAWAPTAIEKKIDGAYKYFYYFTAAQKIGVAVSDSPTGPFVDSGEPLISERPKGTKGGQEIDPDIFLDPVSGKSYLYWGNGHMACVELNDDMVSIKENSLVLLNPDSTFREGTEVFYRKGKYYFMWSEDDTRSPNYRVRYATSNSPTGPLNISENNIVIEKRPENGIYGTGHNSVIQTPGTDVWHIVYHRFNRPKGITMGDAAGFNREVCIDKLEFNDDGSIKPVEPTVTGIKSIN